VNIKSIFIAFLFALTAGCATSAPAPDLRATVPVCSNARQCEAMWSAARDWVASSCEMKIQTMSDGYVETFNSIGTAHACRATRDPDPAGDGYAFHILVGCANPFMCNAVGYVQAFQRGVTAAGEAFK
jgi:hypothetical protein